MFMRAPEVKMAVVSFPLFLMWEIFQSPFYADAFEDPWDRLLYNRLHCSVVDVLIMLGSFWVVALIWGRSWIVKNQTLPSVIFLMIGVLYTIFSEYYNVSIARTWAYSRWMPTLGSIGLIPVFQWLLIPTLVLRTIQSKREIA